MQTESLARAMELGEEAAERITKEFPPPVKLEFEKVQSSCIRNVLCSSTAVNA
jgi:hypothetical protein